MAEREIILEQMLKVLKDIETNTCDKDFTPDTILLEKKMDHIIELHERELHLLQEIAAGLFSGGKQKKKKNKKGKKSKKTEKPETEKMKI